MTQPQQPQQPQQVKQGVKLTGDVFARCEQMHRSIAELQQRSKLALVPAQLDGASAIAVLAKNMYDLSREVAQTQVVIGKIIEATGITPSEPGSNGKDKEPAPDAN